MGWIIAAAVLAALLLVYVFLLMPRLAGRPDMTPLRAVQYAHRGCTTTGRTPPKIP